MSQSIREQIKRAIALRFAPAIDFKAPYAKVMLDMTVNDIFKKLKNYNYQNGDRITLESIND